MASTATNATAIFPNFPYSIDDEPTEDWTVEQVMQLCLLRSHKRTDDKYLENVHQLKEQLEKGKMEILQCHKEALESSRSNTNKNMDENNNKTSANMLNNVNHCSNDKNSECTPMEVENEPVALTGPVAQTKNTSATSVTANNENEDNSNCAVQQEKANKPIIMKNNPGNPASIVHIEIFGGQYDGQKFKLQPKARFPCWIGRSTGKKFRERGISLSKDLEVSTTHGKFETIDGILYFTDTGSTNGTKIGGVCNMNDSSNKSNNFIDGSEVEPNHPIPLSIGLLFTLGQTTLSIVDFD